MFLSRFRVRGYKCLDDVDVALTPIHAVVGRGGCGKTSLLEAISAFQGRLRWPAAQWLPQRPDARELLTWGSDVPTIDLAGQWSIPLDDAPPAPVAGYGYSIVVPPKGANLGLMDQWVRPPAAGSPEPALSRHAYAYPHGPGQARPEDLAAQAAFREVVQKMLLPAPVYSLDPRRLAEPTGDDPERPSPLAADGYGLPALLDRIARQHPQRLAEIAAEFRRLVPQYRDFHLRVVPLPGKRKGPRARNTDAATPDGRAMEFETPSGRKVPAHDVSPGTLRLLALLTFTRLPEPPPLILIEEPERAIHPRLLGTVFESLRQAAHPPSGRSGTQVIFTTWSPSVLNLMQPAEVTLLSRPSEGRDGPVTARPFAEIDRVRQKMATAKDRVRLGDLWAKVDP